MKRKLRVGIIFGGKSAEHEVSLWSAKNVIDALDRKKYDPVLIGIDKTGSWFLNWGSSALIGNPKSVAIDRKVGRDIALVPQSEGAIMGLDGSWGQVDSIDVVFPVLHGTSGEDGTIQGLLKLADIPFVGAGVLGSAVGMDKDVAKRLLRDAGVPVADFLAVTESDVPAYATVVRRFGTPFFVKPANLGSSVGVSKVRSRQEFERAVADAFRYDRKILIEEYIDGREIECAVLGNDDPIASVLGEIIPSHDFYSYEAKYLDEHGAMFEIPAKLSKATEKNIRALAVRTFKTLGCEGMGRVDFFLRKGGGVFVNEINTIPGFTSISMYPKLWEASGVSYSDLVDRLIRLAIERFEKERNLTTSYDAN